MRFLGLLIFLFPLLFLSACNESGQSQTSVNNEVNMSKINDAPVVIKADKIEVIHFHGTQQCWSCITVGKYALKTIQTNFPEEYKNGTIIFMDINGELPENSALVNKFKATGSSLFVNAISNGKDNISEDVTVWRLVSNETQYITYFTEKLNKLLGK